MMPLKQGKILVPLAMYRIYKKTLNVFLLGLFV